MNKKEIITAIKVMKAFANGKEIECKELASSTGWRYCSNPGFNWQYYNYRIKPEPKYRPFKTAEECWNEMLKHEPFGFLSITDEHDYFSICRVFEEEEGKPKIMFASNPYSDFDMAKAFNRCQFVDGTPFGVKEV